MPVPDVYPPDVYPPTPQAPREPPPGPLASVSLIDSDRLYGVEYRPQELALYGEQVRFRLRCAPVFDDPAELTDTHFRLMVLEITAQVPTDLTDSAQTSGAPTNELQLLKIGWELTLRTATAQQVGTLVEGIGEAARLLDRIAEAVNDLARRAGLDAPLGPEVVTHLLTTYRLEGIGASAHHN